MDDVEVRVYDNAFGFIGWISDPLYVTATPRHNQQPTAQVALSGADPKNALVDLDADVRVVIRYRDEYMVGGPVTGLQVEGTGKNRTFVYQVQDYWAQLMTDALLWQVPGSAITAQGAAEYRTVSGPAETVVKTLLGEAITRLGLPVTVATDLGRGATITIKARMDPAADVLLPAIDQAGIGVTVQQDGEGLVLDCYEPSAWPITLSEAGGTLTSLSWTKNTATATRVVGGFDGDGTARNYRARVDAAREAAMGRVIERYVDARDLKVADTDFATTSVARMAQAITDGGPKSGLAIGLAETAVFRYGGDGVHVGDQVTVELVEGATVTDLLREATLTWTKAGVSITPVVGERRDDPTTTLARLIANLTRAVTRQQTRR